MQNGKTEEAGFISKSERATLQRLYGSVQNHKKASGLSNKDVTVFL